MSIPKQAVDLIIDFEGLDQPWRRPGGDSGITIGYGYDLGFEENFEKDWDGVLTAEEIDILKPAIGLRGNAAAARQKQFDAVTINSQQARAVFLDKTLPHYESEAALAFTGIEKLPDIVRGALVSLVYNRGTAMEGPRRTEMRGIRAAIGEYARGAMALDDCLRAIAKFLRIMKRLWQGQGMGGLLRRREAEAQLVESAIGA